MGQRYGFFPDIIPYIYRNPSGRKDGFNSREPMASSGRAKVLLRSSPWTPPVEANVSSGRVLLFVLRSRFFS